MATASKKDMRREDLSTFYPSKISLLLSITKCVSVIPYKEPSVEKSDEIANTMATTLPMVAVSLS